MGSSYELVYSPVPISTGQVLVRDGTCPTFLVVLLSLINKIFIQEKRELKVTIDFS